MRVAEDDDVCLGVELRQAAGNALIGLTVVRQAQPLGDHVQAFQEETRQTRLVTMEQHHNLSGEAEFDYGWQGCTTIGEVLNVDVTPHGVYRGDGPQRFQCCRGIHVTGVQDQVYSGKCVEDCARQPFQAMRDVCVGEQADGESGHLGAWGMVQEFRITSGR